MPCVALIYHDVVDRRGGARSGFEGAGPSRYKLTPARFSEHLAAIASTGRHVGLVDNAAVLLTFDDGGASAVSAIAPALASKGWHGHFFVPTAHVGATGFADADGLRALRRDGHVVGAHGHTHRMLHVLPEYEIRAEWRTSKRLLEELLDEEVTTASVPRGYASHEVVLAAAEAGFLHLFTSEPTVRTTLVGRMTVHGRFSVIGSTSSAHVAALCRGRGVARARAAGAWRVRQAAKRALGPRYERMRGALLRRV